jgi:hypothetical protein
MSNGQHRLGGAILVNNLHQGLGTVRGIERDWHDVLFRSVPQEG